MNTLTLEHIQAEHARIGQLIEQLQTSAQRLLLLREISIELRPGERYAGLVLGTDGLANHHLILLPGEAQDVDWKAAKQAAKNFGGELPTRQEQALLYANLKSEFKEAWYWSGEEHTDSSFAWLQYFSFGYQNYARKSYAGRARAVRRYPS